MTTAPEVSRSVCDLAFEMQRLIPASYNLNDTEREAARILREAINRVTAKHAENARRS